MNSERTVLPAIATIILMAVLQPARANTQGAGVRSVPQRGHRMLASVGVGSKTSQEARATEVMSKLLPELPGKEVVVLTVTYPQGSSDAVHRHNADGFIYVLESSVVMGVNGGEPVTLAPGQTFCEGPNDIHSSASADVVACKWKSERDEWNAVCLSHRDV